MRLLPFACALATACALLIAPAHADPAPNEMVTARDEIDATLAQMKSVSRKVRESLRDARKRGTQAQITCLDEALSRADVALRSARTSGDDALAAYARADLEDARAARRRVAELKEHQRIAARDGSACTVQKPVVIATTGTTVRVVIDPNIARVP